MTPAELQQVFPDAILGEWQHHNGTGGWIHHSAIVHHSAKIQPTACVGKGVRIGEKAEIGGGAKVCNNATIGAWARIGAEATINENVKIGEGAKVSDGVTWDISPLYIGGTQDRVYVSAPGILWIGMMDYPIKWWLKHYKILKREAYYTPQQLEEYYGYILLAEQWMKIHGKWKVNTPEY